MSRKGRGREAPRIAVGKPKRRVHAAHGQLARPKPTSLFEEMRMSVTFFYNLMEAESSSLFI